MTKGLRNQHEVLPLAKNGTLWTRLHCPLCSLCPCMSSPSSSPSPWSPSYATTTILILNSHTLKRLSIPFLPVLLTKTVAQFPLRNFTNSSWEGNIAALKYWSHAEFRNIVKELLSLLNKAQLSKKIMCTFFEDTSTSISILILPH